MAPRSWRYFFTFVTYRVHNDFRGECDFAGKIKQVSPKVIVRDATTFVQSYVVEAKERSSVISTAKLTILKSNFKILFILHAFDLKH